MLPAVILLASLAAAGAAPSPSADALAWGPYATLDGQSRQDPGGVRIHWQREGDTVYEHWIDPGTGKVRGTTTITRDPASGTLHLAGKTFLGKAEWLGTLNADGSVSWRVPGKPKLDYRVRIAEDGAWEMAMRRMTVRYLPADGGGILADEDQPDADPKAWGVYARLAGTRMQGRNGPGIGWQWQDASTLVEDQGAESLRYRIRADGAGNLDFIDPKGRVQRRGRVLADGAVVWMPKGELPIRVSIVEGGVDYDRVEQVGDAWVLRWNLAHLKGRLPDTR